MPESHAHARRRAAQGLAFGLIRSLSVLTIVILGLILGFILWRGLRFDNETRSTVLAHMERSPAGLAIAVNPATDVHALEFPVLLGIFTDEYINWAKISGDGHDLLPVYVDPATPDGRRAEELLFGSHDAAQWGALSQSAPDAAAALRIVASTPGAATIVSAAAAAGREDILLLPLRRLSLAANPEVMALVDNRQVEDLDETSWRRLVTGAVRNWKELGGPDLPVVLLAPPAGSALAAEISAAGYGAAGARARDMAAYVASLAATPGSVGILWNGDTVAAGLSPLVARSSEQGWNLTWRYLTESPRLSGRVGGISTIILNTLFMILLTVVIAAPLGISAAVYLAEYAKQGRWVRLLRLGTETLAGIPSIIFGLFGFLFFVDILHLGFGLLSGCLTLTLMIMPTIIRTTEEALKAVPGSLREGSLALGATRLQTIVRVVIPAAGPGILTGLILGVGRAVGETAALLFTMGSDYKLAKGLLSSARVLSSHVYLLFAEGISFDRAFSTATVLVIVVLAFNFAAKRLVGHMSRNAVQ